MVETVIVGDQRVQITETEDGFEVSKYDPREGTYIRAESSATTNTYGFEMPITGRYAFHEPDFGDDVVVATWNTEDDVSEMNNDGDRRGVEIPEEHDTIAVVSSYEIIEY